MSTFAERLRELRKLKNITLHDLAIDLKTTQATLSRYENGDRLPNIEFLAQLSDYFEVSSDYLLGREHTRTNKLAFTNTEKSLSTNEEKDLIKLINDFISTSPKDKGKLLVIKSFINQLWNRKNPNKNIPNPSTYDIKENPPFQEEPRIIKYSGNRKNKNNHKTNYGDKISSISDILSSNLIKNKD